MKATGLKFFVLIAATATFALGDDHNQGQFKGDLNGFNEVPAVVTTGSGQVNVTVSSDQKSLDVTLKFSKLAGVAQSASLYLGLPGTTGGALAAICGGTKPACPTTADGTVTTTISTNDGIAAQGLRANDLPAVIQAMTSGAVYVNVVTNNFATGEIRGQLRRGFGFTGGRER